MRSDVGCKGTFGCTQSSKGGLCCGDSLSAALEAAKPGCGEIRRILTSSAFRPRLPGE